MHIIFLRRCFYDWILCVVSVDAYKCEEWVKRSQTLSSFPFMLGSKATYTSIGMNVVWTTDSTIWLSSTLQPQKWKCNFKYHDGYYPCCRSLKICEFPPLKSPVYCFSTFGKSIENSFRCRKPLGARDVAESNDLSQRCQHKTEHNDEEARLTLALICREGRLCFETTCNVRFKWLPMYTILTRRDTLGLVNTSRQIRRQTYSRELKLLMEPRNHDVLKKSGIFLIGRPQTDRVRGNFANIIKCYFRFANLHFTAKTAVIQSQWLQGSPGHANRLRRNWDDDVEKTEQSR